MLGGYISSAWQKAKDEEMQALISCEMWNPVRAPLGAFYVGYRWIYSVKYKQNRFIDQYKAYHFAESFSQNYGVDYFKTFSHMARLNSIRILFRQSRLANISVRC